MSLNLWLTSQSTPKFVFIQAGVKWFQVASCVYAKSSMAWFICEISFIIVIASLNWSYLGYDILNPPAPFHQAKLNKSGRYTRIIQSSGYCCLISFRWYAHSCAFISLQPLESVWAWSMLLGSSDVENSIPRPKYAPKWSENGLNIKVRSGVRSEILNPGTVSISCATPDQRDPGAPVKNIRCGKILIPWSNQFDSAPE